MENSGVPKQQTIRELVEVCRKGQMDLDAQLSQTFNVCPPKENQNEDRPQFPNVLDELCEQLAELAASQQSTIRFINDEINIKL